MLTARERERTLTALAELERLDGELLKKRSGQLFPSSWKLLDRMRDKRTPELTYRE